MVRKVTKEDGGVTKVTKEDGAVPRPFLFISEDGIVRGSQIDVCHTA